MCRNSPLDVGQVEQDIEPNTKTQIIVVIGESEQGGPFQRSWHTVERESLAGGKFGELTLFEHLAKEGLGN